MRPRYRLSRRRRLLLAGVALFCLLFQQLAMAAYVCTLPAAPQPVMAGMHDCAAMMGMDHAGQAGSRHAMDPRCTEHCADHVPAQPDARVPAVPPLLLPPDFTAVAKAAVRAPTAAHVPDPQLRPPEPPPSLRFCSLLI